MRIALQDERPAVRSRPGAWVGCWIEGAWVRTVGLAGDGLQELSARVESHRDYPAAERRLLALAARARRAGGAFAARDVIEEGGERLRLVEGPAGTLEVRRLGPGSFAREPSK